MLSNFIAIVKRSILLVSMFTLFACKATSPGSVQSSYGPMQADELLASNPKFTLSYENYNLSEKEVDALKPYADQIKVKVLFGTWCHDSQREVPRFLKLAERLPELEFELTSLDYQKSDPDGMAEKYQVKYTPTFIVFKNGQEIGRIIERPQISIGEDIAKFAAER